MAIHTAPRPLSDSVDPLDMASITYPVVETFHSIQGEGFWFGTAAFFIRLAGCDVGCPWCDTKISWNPKRYPQITVAQLKEQVAAAQPKIIVITGGEPLMHDLGPLTTGLKAMGFPLHLETSGAHPYSGDFDWVTLSPKPFKAPLPEVYDHVSELKVVIDQATDFQWAETQAAHIAADVPKYLQPQWENSASQSLIFDYILAHPEWRLGLQTHKFLGVQ